MDYIESSGVQFAFPLQTHVVAAPTSNDASETGSPKAPASEKKLNEEIAATKSA
jgi:hypothetical protein